MQNTALSLTNIVKRYPGVVALNQVSIEFKQGEVHAIVGENGAGKSTLIKVVAGAIEPDSGEIQMNGLTFSRLKPMEAIEQGVSVIYQEFNLFESLSAAENIFFGERQEGHRLIDFKEMNRKAEVIFKRFNVRINPAKPVRTLSPGQKQIVEIAKAVHKDVKILIMDEPTAPLSLAEVEKLYAIIRDLKQEGITIIYISHRLDEIFALADRVSVMRDGKYIATKEIRETNHRELISLMVGRELKNTYPQPSVPAADIMLEARKVTGNGVHEASFAARSGEILGFAGLVGAGRTELMRVIYGADPLESGDVLVKGQKVIISSPTQALKYGIGLIPEDRKLHGAFLQMSIAWNICISNIKSISSLIVVNKDREREQAEKYRDLLRIKTPSLNQRVMNLSGGNQQKVVLAKVLAARTDMIIFDEPTRGIDVGAKEEIYNLMRNLSDQGKAIIMVSSDMEELLGMSDRIVVMCGGRISGVLSKSEFSQQSVLELASRH